jgi:hypothetical protein
MENHLTCIFYSVHGNLTAKVIFLYALHHPRSLLSETSLFVGYIFGGKMQILEYLHEDLALIRWKPSL